MSIFMIVLLFPMLRTNLEENSEECLRELEAKTSNCAKLPVNVQ